MKEMLLPIYTRLPSETGKGIEFGSIKSRRKVATKVESLLEIAKKRQYQPLVLFLIGEWGEGKTTLYNRYLKDREDVYVFDVQTDVFINFARRIDKKEILPQDQHDAGYNLLAALLLALRDKHGNKIRELIGEPLPGERSYSSVKHFVSKSLEILKKVSRIKSKNRPIILFLDEFETFVLTADDKILRDYVLQGLTNILNGNVTEMFKEEFSHTSLLHLILSLTPPAYAKIKAYAGDILGRVLARIETIKLMPLTIEERYEFIRELLKYMWVTEDDLHTKLFTPPSLLNPLVYSTIGNTRALQQAIEKVITLNTVESENKKYIKSLGYCDFVEILRRLSVVIAGAEVDLINTTTLSSIYQEIDSLRNENIIGVKQTFEFFITTFGAVNIDEVSQQLSYQKEAVKYYLTILNDMFSLNHPLGTLLSTKKFVHEVVKISANYEDLKRVLLSVLNDLLTGSHMLSRLKTSLSLNNEEFVEYLIEKLVLIDEHGKLAFFWPKDENLLYLAEVFKINDSGELDEIYTVISKAIREKLIEKGRGEKHEGYYLVSPTLISALYFSPDLMYLEFVKDRDLRFKIWRKSLQESNPEFLFRGIFSLFIRDDFRLEEAIPIYGSSSFNNISIKATKFSVKYANRKIPIKVVFSTVTANVTEDHIESLELYLRKLRREKGFIPHIVVIAYYGNIQQSAQKKLDKLYDEYFAIPFYIPLPNQLVRLQLASVGLLLEYGGFGSLWNIQEKFLDVFNKGMGYDEEIRIDILKFLNILDTLRKEFRIDKERIFKMLEEKMIVIRPLQRQLKIEHEKKSKIYSEKELISGLRYFLVFPDAIKKCVTSEEVLEFANNYIKEWYFYGQKGILLGDDIESEKELKKRAEILAENGYLLKERNNLYKVILKTPVEKIIESFIERYNRGSETNKISIELLKEYFISPEPSTLDFVIEIMKEKGLLTDCEDHGFVRLLSVGELEKKYAELQEYLKKLKEKDDELIRKLGYFVDGKERGYRAKHLPSFFETLTSIFLKSASEKLSRISREDEHMIAMVYLKVINELLKLYEDDSHKRRGIYKEYLIKTREKFKKLSSQLERILEEGKTLQEKLQSNVNEYVFEKPVAVNLKEITALQYLCINTKTLYDFEYDKETYENQIEDLWNSLVIKKHDAKSKFPFYYKWSGASDRLFYNYKLYKLYELIGQFMYGIKSPLDAQALYKLLYNNPASYEINRPVAFEKIENINTTINKVLEQALDLNRLSNQTKKRISNTYFEFLSEYLPTVSSLKIKPSREEYISLDDLEVDINQWKYQLNIHELIELTKLIDNALKGIFTLEQKIEELKSSTIARKNTIVEKLKTCQEIEKFVSDFVARIEIKTRELEKSDTSNIREDIIRDLKYKIENVPTRKEILTIILQKLNDYVKALESEKKNIIEINSKMNDLYQNIHKQIFDKYILPRQSLILDLIETIKKLNESSIELETEFEYIKNEFDKAFETEDYKRLCMLFKKEDSLVTKAREIIKRHLSDEELEIFITYIEAKKQNPAPVELTRFLGLLKEKLGKYDEKEIEKILMRLILEKKVIVPYI
ncbi:hypothetical protein K1720_07580 [Thermococcus argininiproducens]|uniref:Uncharacterized protein n=1 Tax=Thermococcus argininiproducens TaxID=2866384 RepID=A0A9E7M8L1_9EURY|nr:hypothetical protein [Thermococcus argininiproducens]USG99385.1 hypothetical protein K1720_07580 [Thermococcus argininiproducens]